jgi:glucosamine-6-phosphate deaminase
MYRHFCSTSTSACRRTTRSPMRMSFVRSSPTTSTSTPRTCTVPTVSPTTSLLRAEEYDALIADAGPIDVQLLGIGSNGHIGFNEPGSSLGSRTRVKTLTEQTRHDNARFFTGIDDVPRHVITQGLGTISAARHLVLIATGSHKAEAFAAAVEGPLTASCPGSVLQLHPHVTVVVDDAAAAQLKNADFYRYALKYKPAQQKH